jgi:uncharacterized protein with NRDE domain
VLCYRWGARAKESDGVCFILVLFQAHPSFPLVVAANRDEDRARSSLPPFRWDGEPALWAGRDEVAGGTWLGVNHLGVLGAITNRRDGENDPSFPSRGALCLDVLRQESPAMAAALVAERLATQRYNPFNLLCVNPTDGWVMNWRGARWELKPGVHVVTNRGDLDDMAQPSVERALSAVASLEVAELTLIELLDALGRICADTTEPDPICKPGGPRGTVSSSLIALHNDGSIAAYHHADGPPSEHVYAPVPL